MNKLFVFDLDNTLIDNVHDYSDPILDATRLIIKTLGNKAPHVLEIIQMEQKLDKDRIYEINPSTGKPYYCSMGRFPGTFVIVYQQLCRQAGVTPKKETEKQIYDICMQAFDESRYAHNVKPEALPVLDFLALQGDAVGLCTKGDRPAQNRKIAALKHVGIKHFSQIKIVDINDDNRETGEKTPHDFQKLAQGFTNYTLSVGDSYGSDIVPALEAGFKGIFIPVRDWTTIGKMDEILAKVDRKRCFVFDSLTDIKTRYAEL
ncbi:HAD family hydrolase [Patescibacteria group bacterium AH-259-L07]|nr:HAD family hydrolase [Patescibacteria group bacterium AH-259-L07]